MTPSPTATKVKKNSKSTHKVHNFLSDCTVSHEDAMFRVVTPGARIGSGFATSEPHAFYASLWDHIVKHDITDVNISQALFMAPHRICVGDALGATGLLGGLSKELKELPVLGGMLTKAQATTRKLQGLMRLTDHYSELKRRRITFTSAFIGGATNMVIPDIPLTRMLFPQYAGRNTTRMGVTRMQSIHFPDAVNSLAFDADGNTRPHTFMAVMTPPNHEGLMSHGAANGANGEIVERIARECSATLLLYLNPHYPFTTGYGDAPNTIHVSALEGLARAGKLLVVDDESKIPCMPASSLDNISPAERAIADHVVNHIEMNLGYTAGKALQVGFGGTGVLAIQRLKDSRWQGRCYTEMLETHTWGLFEAGKITGSHFIEKNGSRTQLDGRITCTFTLSEEGTDFYQKLHNNKAVVLCPASRVVIPEGFYHGLGINSCLSIDFHGHVNAGGRDRNHYSGVGGGAMILRGLARGGVAYLCMKSTHRTAEGKLRSSIFPFMPTGTPVSYIGPDLMGGREDARIFLVTEHGVTQLSGHDQEGFIKALISVSDPRFQGWLRRQAREQFGFVV